MSGTDAAGESSNALGRAEDHDGGSVPISVLVPTIGRKGLGRCLYSVASTSPRPAEIVVVEQSGEPTVLKEIQEAAPTARIVHQDATGISHALNAGLRAAAHEIVSVTHDDCTVAKTWAGEGFRLARAHPGAILTGRVLAAGDPSAVPSTKNEAARHDFTGETPRGALYPNNMVLPRSLVLDFGAFDERITPAAEDNDLCYRWLRAGRSLIYEPDLVVWHHHWRSHDALVRLYREYARGQGIFYAKHLRARDLFVLRFLAQDLKDGLRSTAAGIVRGRPRWSDPRRAYLRGLPVGLVRGWRIFSTAANNDEQ